MQVFQECSVERCAGLDFAGEQAVARLARPVILLHALKNQEIDQTLCPAAWDCLPGKTMLKS